MTVVLSRPWAYTPNLVALSCSCCKRLWRFLGFLALLLSGCQLHAAAKHGAIFHADARADHITGQCAFAADVHAVAALNVASDLAHDHNFARGNVGLHNAVAADCHAMIFEAQGAFDAAVNVKRLAAADLAFDHQRASDGGLLDGRGHSLDWRGWVEG